MRIHKANFVPRRQVWIRPKDLQSCCTVDEFCEAPANLEPLVGAKLKCFSCGQPVCKMCSDIRTYYTFGEVRLCHDCQIDYDGSDEMVMRKLFTLAGQDYDKEEIAHKSNAEIEEVK